MTTEKIIHSHQLVITFNQDENAHVHWQITPDNAVESTSEATCEQLAKAGAPLAALGIRVLLDMLSEQLITIALDKANNHIWQEHLIQLQNAMTGETPALEAGVDAESEEVVVIH